MQWERFLQHQDIRVCSLTGRWQYYHRIGTPVLYISAIVHRREENHCSTLLPQNKMHARIFTDLHLTLKL